LHEDVALEKLRTELPPVTRAAKVDICFLT
jgi:hypothetical protein